jgi:hypothetical protein
MRAQAGWLVNVMSPPVPVTIRLAAVASVEKAEFASFTIQLVTAPEKRISLSSPSPVAANPAIWAMVVPPDNSTT